MGITLPAVIFEGPHAQAMAVVGVLITALCLQVYHWPWRSQLLNKFDAFTVAIVIGIVTVWFPTAKAVTNTKPFTTLSSIMLMSLFLLVFGLFIKCCRDMKAHVDKDKDQKQVMRRGSVGTLALGQLKEEK